MADHRFSVFVSFCGVAAIISAVGLFFVQQSIWRPVHLVSAIACFCLLAFVISCFWAAHHGGRRFGQANQVTLLRSGFVSLIGGSLLPGGVGSDIGSLQWALIATALALDAIDGYLARRLGLVSTFGARFDIEIDALLLLILSLLVWQSGKVGVWVLAIGLVRYVFVAAGWCLTSLAVPLRPSLRRKIVAMFQGIALLACLLPFLDQSWASMISAIALGALLLSFGLDVFSLLHPIKVGAGIQAQSES